MNSQARATALHNLTGRGSISSMRRPERGSLAVRAGRAEGRESHARLAFLVVLLLVATAALALLGSVSSDPLAPYRTPDGSLRIPGSALTPQIERLLFGGNDLQTSLNLTSFTLAASPFPTARIVERGYQVPNPNVFTHPGREPGTLVGGLAHLIAQWFPPVDWGAQLHAAAGWFFGLFTWDARASVTVDSTTVTDINTTLTCTTSQTAAASDNGVLVLLSERGTSAFASVTYGTTNLSLIASTAANGGTMVRTEIWGFAGTLPGGVQIMTATLSGVTKQGMTCATILLQGVKSTGSFINGTSGSANSTNATITLAATVTAGNLAFAVASLQNSGGGGNAPTAVAGTGATATDLYGVAVVHCSGGGNANECAAGASIPNPGTAITWTNPATQWVVSAVEVVATPTCGTIGGGNCYRIGVGGSWTSGANWSNTPGGAACSCTPLAADFAFFNASPTGTSTLAAATTVAGLDMTGFTGTLDTTASNWSLTVNGNLTLQGTLLPRGSTVAVAGNVTILGATTVVTMATSVWTVSGSWTNNSTSASWSAGTGTVTIKDATSATLTFANLGAVNEFNNLTLDASVAAGLTYTMATNGLRMAGTLTVQNSTGGATGYTVLDTSASNLAIAAGALTLGGFGAVNTEASSVTVNGAVTVSTAGSYLLNTGGTWAVAGAWSDASTSASWSFAAAITFQSGTNQTMTFGGQVGNEFSGAVSFDSAAIAGVTYTMATNALDVAGTLTVRNSAGGATGPVILNTSAGNLAVNAGGLALSTLGAFNSRGSAVTISGGVNISAANAYVANTGAGSWAVTGPWTNRTSSASWAFAASITFRAGAAQSLIFTGSNIAGNEFGGNVTLDTSLAAGITYTMAAGATGDSSLKVGGALVIRNSAGGATAATLLDTSASNFAVTAASLTLGNPRGAFRSEGSTIRINGAVTISDANSYLVFGAAVWTVTGAWTNTSTDAVDWSAGTGTVTFRNAASASFTFANLGANEFNSVTFDTSTAAGITYTMLTNGLRMAGSLTIQNTAASPTGNAVLTTSASNLAITASNIVLGVRGTLSANGSTITVNGSWTSTAANHVWTSGTSTVVFAANGTVTTSAGDSFNNLTQTSGTTTLGSNVTVAGITTVNGTLDTSGSSFGLTLLSSLSIGATGVLNLEASIATTSGNVTIAAGGAVRFTGAGQWTINGSWTDSNTSAPAGWAVASSTVRFVGGAATTLTFWTAAASNEFNNITLDASVLAGFTYTQVNALQASGTLTVQNTAAGATGAVLLDASASNYAATIGGLTLGALGAYVSRAATVTVNGNTSVAASAYITSGAAGTWTVAGSWTNGSTSASWSFAAPITFRSATNQTMTFAGTNLAGAEFSVVTFNSGAAAVTFTMSTQGLTAGTITVQGGTAVTTLATSNLALSATTLTVAANGSLTAGSSTITVQSIGTAAGAFTAGTSTIVVNASGGTVNVPQTVSSMTVGSGLSTIVASALTFSGTLTLTSATVTFNSDLTSSGASAAIAFSSATLSVAGSWNTASVSAANFTSASSSVSLTGASKSVGLGAGCAFAALTVLGTVSQTSPLTAATLFVSAGGLAKGTNPLTVNGNLTLGGGYLSSVSGSVLVAGNVNVSSAASYISFGSETWTVNGSWTNASTSASWSSGTGTVVFAPGGSGTYTFGNLPVAEFNNVQLTPTAAATYTMATNGLRWGGTLTLSTNATLATGNLPLTGGSVTVGNGGVLTANASIVAVSGVTMTGGASGTITITTGSWTVSGNWDTSGAGSTLTQGSSSVTLSGAAGTVKLLAGQQFATLTVGGTIAQASDLKAAALTVTGSLTKTGFNLIANALTATAGTITDGTVSVSNFTVTDNDSTAYITLSVFSAWTANTQYAWTHTDSKTTDTITFTISGQTGTTFNVYKNGALFTSGGITGGNIVFTMLGSDPNVVVNASGCGGNSRYWVQGTGNWSQTSHWASTSGGVGGCSAPGPSTSVFFDANSGTGTSTVDVNESFQSLDTTGSSIATIALGTNSLTISGNATLAAGTFTIGASAGTGLGVGGNLALSGTAVLDGSSGPSVLSVAGNVTVSSATAYMRLGTGTWTVSGAWSNASTSASWSPGTGTIAFNGSGALTMTFAGANLAGNEFNNVTFNGGNTAATFTLAARGLRVASLLTVQGGTAVTTLDLSAANLPLTASSLTIGTNGTLNGRGSAIGVSGNWDSHLGTFTAGTSTVTMSGAASTVNTASAFATLIVSGSYSQASAVTAGATTISGSLSTSVGNFALSVGSLTVTGALAGNGSAIGVSGNWDSHLGTFTAGTSTITMSGAATVLNTASAFASLHVTGTVTLASSVTAATALLIDTSGSLDASASNYAVNAASLTVGATGTLNGRGSTISVTSMDTHLGTFTVGSSSVIVNASSGTINIPQTLNVFTVNASVTTTIVSNLAWSGALTLNTGDVVTVGGNLTSVGAAASLALNGAALTVSGNWDTSSTAASFAAGTSSVTLNGAASTYKTAAGQTLNGMTVSGTVTLASDLKAVSLTVTGTLTKTSFNLIFNTLTDNTGTIRDGAVNASNFLVTNSETTAFTTISVFSVWSTNVQYGWTHTSSSPTTTITFTLTGVTASVYSVTKNSVLFASGSVTAGQVQFTMLGSDPVVLVTLSGCTGTDEYWVLGSGNWSDTSHWATSSGGVGGCPSPLSTINVHLDANSGAGTLTVDVNVSIASLNLTGSTIGTFALGSHDFGVSGNVVLAAGTITLGTSAGIGLAIGGSLTLSGSAGLDGSGGASIVSVTGSTTIATPTAYFRMGSGTWTFSGSWSNSSTSASWSAGTGSVVFREAASATMTFGNLSTNEFNNVTFDTSSVSGVVLTMATNGLVWSGTLTVQGTAGPTTLATGGLALVGGVLVVGNGGLLTAGASTVDVSQVTMTAGASGAITLTTGSWTVSGNWDTSGAGSTLTAGTSTVTFTGTGVTIRVAAGQMFYNVVIGGSASLASAMTAVGTLTVDTGSVLTKTGQNVAFNGLVENGTGSIVDGSVNVVNFTVTNSDATNVTTISSFTRWTPDAEFTWTATSTVGTSTLTFTIGGNTGGNRFDVTKDGAAFTSGLVDTSGNVVFTMLGSDPTIDVVVAAPCGSTRYWTGGVGNWSQTAHWSSASGGAGGCSVPNASMNVIFDANSGAGVVTLDQNASIPSLNTTGWAGTIALGTFNLSVSGTLTHAAGTIAIGSSAGTGLTVGGDLLLSGSAALDGSGGASLVAVTGNVSITSAAAYVRMGSGTWTVGGAWTNASTSANWSAGTGTVVFESTTSQTMTFAGLAGGEFYNVTFNSAANGGSIVFTMATRSLTWAGTLTIQDTAGSTTTLATANLALAGGSLMVGDAGVFLANASTVTVANVTMNGGASGTITLTSGVWTVGGDWNTSGAGSVFTKGASTVILAGAPATVALLGAANGFYNLTVSGIVTASTALDVSGALNVTGTFTTGGNGVTGSARLTVSQGGTLLGTTSAFILSAVTMNDAATNTLSLTTGTITDSGSWDTSGSASQFLAGTSSVTLTGAAATLQMRATQSFANLVVVGTYSLASAVAASTLSIPSGGLAMGANPLTVTGNLTLSGGFLSALSGAAAIAGSVDVSAASSYIVFGSGSWTVSGSWTNGSTSSSWSAGTGTVTFSAASDQTMTFAGAALGGDEFNAVVFDAGANTVTFTLAGAGLAAHTITIQGGSGTTRLSTSSSNWSLTADTVTVAAGGALQANGSTITVRSMDTTAGSFAAGTSTIWVAASGGTVAIPQALYNVTVATGVSTTFSLGVLWSGTMTLTGATVSLQGGLTASGPADLTFTGATLTVLGSWDTSTAAAFVAASSSVTLGGTAQTVTLASGQAFATLTVSGTAALGSDLSAATLDIPVSGQLTKTGHSLTFNELTVSGTLTDGSVNVSNLTVANSDTTAWVTISVFSSWSAGSLYAWTHTSSESSQTITWTIGGNTPGHLYRVTKNGTAYSNGTVEQSGNVVFTMLGSDPDMQVIVTPPPIPAWWQSPYFLAIPPIGLLVVVTMFAQRRRWRPAKAFLVDERGQLLREFTLDPSCEVSYDQALQAGALDAVDKDVRVSKYHARAVRGDMLSLIMLAVGPANVQEVEFARGILVNIQDKFEDRVKARVEEARAEEANLQATNEAIEEERVDLQARARVFGDMVNALTIARGKLDGESRSIQAQSDDLTAREQAMAEVRQSLEEQAERLEKLRTSMDETSAQLDEQKQELAVTLDTLNERESRLAPKEADLSARNKAVTEKEREVVEREEALSAAEAKLTADLDDHHAKAQELHRLEAELTEERKALDDLSVRLDGEQTRLDTRVADVDSREKSVSAAQEDLSAKLAALEPREKALAERQTELAAQEAEADVRTKALADEDARLTAMATDLRTREASLATRTEELAGERTALDDLTKAAVEERKALDAKAASLQEREAEVAKRMQDLEDMKANLGPREAALLGKETDLQTREKTLAEERTAFQNQQDLVAAKALEIQQQLETIREKEAGLAQEEAVLQEAKGAFDSQRQQLDARMAAFGTEEKQRLADLADRERTLGEANLRLTKDRQDFEGLIGEKNQWIGSKEIELEAKEQRLADREAEIRAQAEENARHLSELAAREETLEIESAKLDKTRAESESRKAELGAMGRDIESRTAKLREEETRKAEELRTWQTTLESEQALSKEQKESFEREMQDLRESWAGRMIRVEQKEEELKERETKVQADVEWVARNENELGKREKLATENLKQANDLKTETERLRVDFDQRALELESRERSLREEAANQSVELEKRAESLQASQMELAGQRAQWERELATQTDKLKQHEIELTARKESVDAKDADLSAREVTLKTDQDALREEQERIGRERTDLGMMEQRLQAAQLEVTQVREKLDADTIRVRNEADAIRQSLAEKEANLLSERERLERDSTSLQDKLGGKAKELAAREKGIAAREDELRSEEQDLEARMRELESSERQAEARLAEIVPREKALAQGEQELKSGRATFNAALQKFQVETDARQKEWHDLQASLKSQEKELAVSTESRQAEIRKRMADLEQREQSINAMLAQAQMERASLEAQAKTQTTRQAEIDAAIGRAEKRSAELKAMEDEILKSRQTFESEKASWTSRRAEELKQLEATRDAAGEQTQQAERLIEESQRRAYVAAEAEKASKRQAEELAAAQKEMERRRAEAEKAEKDLEAQMAELRAASQKLGAKEVELTSHGKELETLQNRLVTLEKKTTEASDELKARKATLDQEADRIAALAAQMDKRQAEDESRRATLDGKFADLGKREQVLSTELQRADNLMEDLNRKETELVAREKTTASKEDHFAAREAALARRDAELVEGMQTLERLRKEHEERAREVDEHHRVATQTRKEAAAMASEAEKMKTQADSMQAEVSKNMRFLQKKALDILDREEKIRTRENRVEEDARVLETRAQVIEKKEKSLEAERDELAARLERVRQDNEKLKAKLAEAEKAGKSTIDMDEWKRDIDNRVKIIQKKALDLLDREEKLRKKEDELKALAIQMGIEYPK